MLKGLLKNRSGEGGGVEGLGKGEDPGSELQNSVRTKTPTPKVLKLFRSIFYDPPPPSPSTPYLYKGVGGSKGHAEKCRRIFYVRGTKPV